MNGTRRHHILFASKSLAWALLLFLAAMAFIYWEDLHPASVVQVVTVTNGHDTLSYPVHTMPPHGSHA